MEMRAGEGIGRRTSVAEGVGFEPTIPGGITVFKLTVCTWSSIIRIAWNSVIDGRVCRWSP